MNEQARDGSRARPQAAAEPWPHADPETRRQLRSLRRIARLLDSSIPIGGRYRIGLDGLVGLIPGIGDAVGASLSSYLIIRAARLGVGTRSLIHMMFNVLLESVIGTVPVLGDLFDFAWKANEKNLAILERNLPAGPSRGEPGNRLTLAVTILLSVFVAIIMLLIVLTFMAIAAMV